jgi:FkbM family methyltransferase
MILTAAKRTLRRLLEARGYYVRSRAVLPYGVDYLADIGRLSEEWNLPIRMFFDVGANIGQTTSAALKSFPNARVLAFEPLPKIFLQLVQAIGSEPRFAPYNIALAEHCGSAPFFENEISYISSLASNAVRPPNLNAASRQLTVQCSTIDAFCAEHQIDHIDVLKIDTEGCELMVLQGSERMLAQRRIRFIYAEFFALENAGLQMTALGPLYRYLAPFGFRFVATYTDSFFKDENLIVGNALFVLPP